MPDARYYADLHVHSHYSRATSPTCTPEGLYKSAQLKGVGVCGTGDCTHPVWLAELREKLVEDSCGLYQLKPRLTATVDPDVPQSCRRKVHFMVTGEISSIYKRDGRTRKVHSLILMPSLSSAALLNERLAKIGNIASDGRPILGLDVRDLLEIMLQCDSRSILIPAHIWTPWFSMLGAKSGFDSVAECFGAYAQHIFAVETGLSSDAPMNHRIHCIERMTLMANSDLHSPDALGRNATIFFGQPSYDGLIKALRTKDGTKCGGTVHLFPEAGKYHSDGHRACGVRLTPEQSTLNNNICPVCQKPVTMGVLHRIVELERQQATAHPLATDTRLPHCHIIPLPELIAQSLGVKSITKKVVAAYTKVLAKAGSELPLLLDVAPTELAALGVVGEMIQKVRSGQVTRESGYDGIYGTIKVV